LGFGFGLEVSQNCPKSFTAALTAILAAHCPKGILATESNEHFFKSLIPPGNDFDLAAMPAGHCLAAFLGGFFLGAVVRHGVKVYQAASFVQLYF